MIVYILLIIFLLTLIVLLMCNSDNKPKKKVSWKTPLATYLFI